MYKWKRHKKLAARLSEVKPQQRFLPQMQAGVRAPCQARLLPIVSVQSFSLTAPLRTRKRGGKTMDGQVGGEENQQEGVFGQDQTDFMWACGAATKHMIKNTHQHTHNIYRHQHGNLNVISTSSVHTVENIISHPNICGEDSRDREAKK